MWWLAKIFRSKSQKQPGQGSDGIVMGPETAAPSTEPEYLRRANAYLDARNTDSAIADCSAAIQLNPKSAVAYRLRGWSMALKAYDTVYRGNLRYGELFEQALADYEMAICLDPDDWQIYRNRGVAYRRMGAIETMKIMGAGLDMSAGDWQQYYDLSITDYDTAIRMKPDDPGNVYSRGLAYRDRGEHGRDIGDLDKAITDFDEAVRLNPSNAAEYLHSREIAMHTRVELA